MLSRKKNFLFIHLPKTAGNSIQSLLKEYSEDQLVCVNDRQDGVERFEVRNSYAGLHKHSKLLDYKKALPESLFNNLFKFSTVRNPWDRVISHYFSPHRQVTHWDRKEFIELIQKIPTLQQMLMLHADDSNSLSNVNFLLHFENLSHDFDKLCKRIDIPSNPLPFRNRSLKPLTDYRKFYDSELIAMVGEKFKDEILFGNYQFK